MNSKPSPQRSVVAGRSLLDAGGAADYMRCNERFVRRLVAERRIPFHKLGRHVRFDVADLDRFIETGRVETGDGAA